MNFQTVRDDEGQMDGQYQAKIGMFGIPQDVGEVLFTLQGKQYQQVMITDDKGETQKVKIYGGKMLATCCGQRLSFEVAPNTSDKNRQTYYSGFWKDRAIVQPQQQPPQGQQAPQQSQQTASQATQRPNASKPTPINNNRLIVAQVVYKAFVEMYAITPQSLDEFDIWFMKGLNVYNRHIDTIMQAGAGTLAPEKLPETSFAPSREQTEPDAPDDITNPNYEENPRQIEENDPIPF